MGEIYPIASIDGSGTGELLDAVVEKFASPEVEENRDLPRLAILGRPNVGKSSLLNALVGEERTIVTDISGTTRDSIHTRYNLFGKDFILTDTAGIRKKAKVSENIEFYSVMRAIRALQDSDICLVLIDAQHGLESQDLSIISLAHKYKKGILIIINKWDLAEKATNTAKKIADQMSRRLGTLDYIPVLFTSVLKKQRIHKALEYAVKIYENRKQRIQTSKLNDLLLAEIEKTPPPAVSGKYIKIKYITQLPPKTPVFAFFCNHPQHIKPAYQRFLENKIRKHFDFEGVPISLIFRKK